MEVIYTINKKENNIPFVILYPNNFLHLFFLQNIILRYFISIKKSLILSLPHLNHLFLIIIKIEYFHDVVLIYFHQLS